MAKSRRQFLTITSMGILGASAALQGQNTAQQNPADLPPGAPPAFGAGPAVGPEAEKREALAGVAADGQG